MFNWDKKEAPLKALAGLGGGVGRGGGPAGDSIYVDDVFSVDPYVGNSSTQQITNGVDLSTEGGMVMRGSVTIDSGNGNYGWIVNDTVNGAGKRFWPARSSNGLGTQSDSITSFNTDGYTMGSNTFENYSSDYFVGYTFRKCPKFFDVVNYTGNGSSQWIPHSLDAAIGAVLILCRDGGNMTGGAFWHHVGRGNSDGGCKFFEISPAADAVAFTAQAQQFRVYNGTAGFGLDPNLNGVNYTAYIFAKGDTDAEVFGKNSDESIIKCGHFTTTASTESISVELGWEPGLVISKCTSQTGAEAGYWYVHDFMRGFARNKHGNIHLNPHNSTTAYRNQEIKYYAGYQTFPTGFIFDDNNNGSYQGATGTHAYIAIRRPGHKPSTTASKLFQVYQQGTGANVVDINYNITPDLLISKKLNSNSNDNMAVFYDRSRGSNKYLTSTDTALETDTGNIVRWDRKHKNMYVDNDSSSVISNGFTYAHFLWKRSAKFFDIVTWQGINGVSSQNVSHNLQVPPEMVISKMSHFNSSYGGDKWYVYHKNAGTDSGGSAAAWDSHLALNQDNAQVSSSGQGIFGSAPTATNLPFDNPSGDGLAVTGSIEAKYVAYLFASLEGVSKVGYYTGQSGGSYVADTLGFTPKFIMIKAADRTGKWIVFNSERGLTVGGTSATAVALNNFQNETQTSETDAIRATTDGFTVNTGNASTDINENGKKYLYYAVA